VIEVHHAQLPAEATLSVNHVVAGYRPDLPILHGVSLHVNAGEIVTIIGPNGAGKSTLIKAVAGIVDISEGEVALNGADITNVAAHKLASAGIGFVPQTANVFTSLTIRENLIIGGAALTKKTALQRMEAIYALYPILRQRASEKAAVLSGGQRQILALARALLTAPRLIMLDEPTAGLSPIAATELFDVVKNLASDGVAVLMVEQNAKAALRVSDRAYVLVEGQNRLHGSAQSLLEDQEIGAIFLGRRADAHNITPTRT